MKTTIKVLAALGLCALVAFGGIVVGYRKGLDDGLLVDSSARAGMLVGKLNALHKGDIFFVIHLLETELNWQIRLEEEFLTNTWNWLLPHRDQFMRWNHDFMEGVAHYRYSHKTPEPYSFTPEETAAINSLIHRYIDTTETIEPNNAVQPTEKGGG